jgi:hypothetical protein
MTEPVFSISNEPSDSFLSLAWEVFFLQRSRGFSMAAHFPWVAGQNNEHHYVTLHIKNTAIAGLAAKVHKTTTSTSEFRIAVLGLVCVHPSFRGQNFSKQLIKKTLDFLMEDNVDAVTLWTGKPKVYAAQGFKTEDSGFQASVQSKNGFFNTPDRYPPVSCDRWPDIQEVTTKNRGLPPFALHAQRLSVKDTGASAIVIFDSSGPAIAEWQGENKIVTDMLIAAMPARWRLHFLAGDTLPKSIQGRNMEIQSKRNDLQMWNIFNPAFRPIDIPLTSHFRLLDRI